MLAKRSAQSSAFLRQGETAVITDRVGAPLLFLNAALLDATSPVRSSIWWNFEVPPDRVSCHEILRAFAVAAGARPAPNPERVGPLKPRCCALSGSHPPIVEREQDK